MNRLTISIIILILVIIGGIGAYFIFQKPSFPQSLTPSERSSNNVKPLFGTMIAFSINDATVSMPGILDAIGQKGWTEFRKDDSAYQNLLSNLKKLIQDRTKLVKETSFSLDREIIPYFTWNVIEPQKGQFDWELTDLYAQATSNAGVKISAVIQPFASWDQKNTQTNKDALDFAYYDYKAGPPKDIAEYQNFLTKMVERYKDKVTVWEIGNEPENPGSGYQNNPEGYFNLVKITSETIKKADPKAKITNGGAMPIVGMRESDLFKTFWTKFFALGGDQYFDYFNVHYNIERSPDAKLDPATFEKNLMAFNNLMDKNGGRKPLYITEFGIYSGSPSSQPPRQPIQGQATGQNVQPNQEQTLRNLSENEQAALYFKDSILAFTNGANVIFIDLVGGDNDIIGSSMAFNTEGQPRLFLATLKTIASKIDGFSDVKKITDSQYKFTVDNKTIYALWSGTLPNEISGKVKVTDMKGQEQIMDAAVVKLSANQPVFIEL